jgi:hypothetical protein
MNASSAAPQLCHFDGVLIFNDLKAYQPGQPLAGLAGKKRHRMKNHQVQIPGRRMVRAMGALALLSLAITIAAAIGGCSHATAQQQQINTNGAAMQAAGVMTQADYVKIRAIGDQSRQTGSISDADLSWSLDLLKNSNSPIGRARVMGVLIHLRGATPAQKSQIVAAVSPLTTSSNALDQKYSASVLKRMQ